MNEQIYNPDYYDYHLPVELIAQYPLADRPASKLLAVDRKSRTFRHTAFRNIMDFLHAGDLLVLNTSKVIPARLYGTTTAGANIEILLVTNIHDDLWSCMAKPGRRLKHPVNVSFSPELNGLITPADEDGMFRIEFSYQGDFWQILENIGYIPLPPYIKRADQGSDKQSYQTVYARQKGSVAAPTAGLHFDQVTLDRLADKGVNFAEVVLHVGPGTFLPVKTTNILEHKMHYEHCTIDQSNAELINLARQEGRRIIAVGTTSARTLESFGRDGVIVPGSISTNLFIYPGWQFRIVDALITNFHLPKSTLLMLVSALADRDLIMEAYHQAIENNYRFFSYGDAMIIY